jgi:hypothetical protein
MAATLFKTWSLFGWPCVSLIFDRLEHALGLHDAHHLIRTETRSRWRRWLADRHNRLDVR